MIDLSQDYSILLSGQAWNDIVARLRKFPMDEVEPVVQEIRRQIAGAAEKLKEGAGNG